MSIDLETRLLRYGQTLDRAIESDLIGDVELVESSSRGHGTSPRRLILVAAVGLLVGGSAALLTDRHADYVTSNSEFSPTTVVAPVGSTTTTTSGAASVDSGAWDEIRVAPGTTGWFEFGPLPARLTAIVPTWQSWTPEYTAQFYDCVTYATDTDGPICNGLRGGNYVAPITFGGTGELGTHIGDVATADLAWTLAQGSLWGYDEMPSPPPATPVRVGAHDGVKYSNNDTTYLVWEQAPGIHLWLRATGISDADLVALATTVVPQTLPDHLPLPILLDAADTTGTPTTDALHYGWQQGRPCVGFSSSGVCTNLDGGNDVLVTGFDGVGGPLAAVAAVSPIGSTARLRIALADNAADVEVAPVDTPIGLRVSVYRPGRGTERVIAANVEGSDGSIIARQDVPIRTFLGGLAPDVIGEGRTTGGRAWVVSRQDPSRPDASTTMSFTPGSGPMPYCWLLTSAHQLAGICQPVTAPTVGLGEVSTGSGPLRLVEIASTVSEVRCDGESMPILTDTELDGRRFAVVTCDAPATVG